MDGGDEVELALHELLSTCDAAGEFAVLVGALDLSADAMITASDRLYYGLDAGERGCRADDLARRTCEFGRSACLSELLRGGSLPRPDLLAERLSDGETAALSAAREGHLGCLELIISATGSEALLAANDSDQSVLHSAVMGGHLDVVERVVAELAEGAAEALGAQNWRGQTPAVIACGNGDLQMLRYLVHVAGPRILRVVTVPSRRDPDRLPRTCVHAAALGAGLPASQGGDAKRRGNRAGQHSEVLIYIGELLGCAALRHPLAFDHRGTALREDQLNARGLPSLALRTAEKKRQGTAVGWLEAAIVDLEIGNRRNPVPEAEAEMESKQRCLDDLNAMLEV